MKKKVGIFLSHPIQYFSPLFKHIQENSQLIELKVYYFSDVSIRQHTDHDFGTEVKWDLDLLEGYDSEFIKNFKKEDSPNGFFTLINFGVFSKVKNENFDLVISFGWSTLSNLFVLFAARMFNVPFALRGEAPFMYEASKKGLKKKLRACFLGSMFKKASALFYIGTQNKKFYQQSFDLPDNKLFFTPYSINNNYFIQKANEYDIEKEKKKLGIGNEVVIVFSGKLIERKKPKILLQALKQLDRDKYKLLFVGSGVQEEALKDIAEKDNLNVDFLGFINQAEIPKYYTLADIFILPSMHETWGLVVNEAMCCKTAIITSNLVGSSYDLIEEEKNGYVVEVDDADALAQKIQLLLDDKDKLERFKEHSLTLVQRWGYTQILEGLEKYLQNGRH